MGKPRRKWATEAPDLLWKQQRGTHETADLDLNLTAHRHQISNLAQAVSRCKQKDSHRTSTTNNFGPYGSEVPVTPTRAEEEISEAPTTPQQFGAYGNEMPVTQI